MESESAPGDTGLPRSTSDENDVAEALGRLCDMAALRRPDDPLLVRFLPLYYSELPAGDVDDRKLDDIYAVAVSTCPWPAFERPVRRSCGWCHRIVSATGGTRSTPCSSSSPRTCRSSSTRRAWCSSAWVSASTCWCTRCSRSSATRRTGSPTWRRTSPTSRGPSRRGRRSRSTAPTRRRRRSWSAPSSPLSRTCAGSSKASRRCASAWRSSVMSIRSCRGSQPGSSCSSGRRTTTSPTMARSGCGPAASWASLATSRASPSPVRCPVTGRS